MSNFVNAMLSSVAITLGIILTNSLKKHEDAIRLFEVYTGDIAAFAMEVIAFIEEAGRGQDVKHSSIMWDHTNMGLNNSEQVLLSKPNYDPIKILHNLLEKLDAEVKKFKRPSQKTAVRRQSINHLRQSIVDIRKSIVDLGDKDAPLSGDRYVFLLSLERIFETLYILPHATKYEFRSVKEFDWEKLKPMNVKYCHENPHIISIDIHKSKIYKPYSELEKMRTKIVDGFGLSKKNATPTQTILLLLLDFVNELHRSIGVESQTRRTLTTAWRRLYGTYGDLATVRTYELPMIVSRTLEMALFMSSLMIPYTKVDIFLSPTLAPWGCVAIQFFLVGLYIGVEKVRNPFVRSDNAIGFKNVSATARQTQETIRYIWFVRGTVQQLTPIEIKFNVDCPKPEPEITYTHNHMNKDSSTGGELKSEDAALYNTKKYIKF